jgi:hypothetical protein
MAEWAGHRYVLHFPVPGLKMAYKRHCSVHHRFFTDQDLTYHGQKEWRALLFPPCARGLRRRRDSDGADPRLANPC